MSATDIAMVGAVATIFGAGWAVVAFAGRLRARGPVLLLTVGALLLIGGNLYDEEPLSALDAAAFVALALGFAASSYTIVRRRRGMPRGSSRP